jgi:LacI family transcriptional regulator
MERRKVALIVTPLSVCGQGISSGIAKYVRGDDSWSVYYQNARLNSEILRWLKNWNGDGVILHSENQEILKISRQIKAPIVYVGHAYPNINAPQFLIDNKAISKICFEHFKERGFKNFAFCGAKNTSSSAERCKILIELVKEKGWPFYIYSGRRQSDFESFAKTKSTSQRSMADWIIKLPKPIGIMACNDFRGKEILDICVANNIASPEEVAVLGIGNDQIVCNLSDPALSSVVTDTEAMGYKAAALLTQMMNGSRIKPRQIFIEPKGIILRASTNMAQPKFTSPPPLLAYS